ncbi:transcriptional regulator, GntR family [Pseudopedobacter saltans DSM 12145]|uniref:Transcriptional regulator, GntR family n=1 Tax=Pseudopedobacter saltans (strain ATCC 51119 / DSM 12145 / JCM 21818 / CCUG 39354 / LMG 10337 / NBRC 100064 / NCIMB 13643) TaxID=762903 RepID=F0S6G9_PSESL|nr:GntR family transcriptional regulator [Pseudopedobacter saltans]ADY54295.1 transcriptional regulator, GntR family [Pseudopedobacter saltans DSM 12145]
MKASDFLNFIFIDEYSATPKYLQLSYSIIAAIEDGKITKDDLLPSINELSYLLEISRDTAEKGYRYLKKMGVIVSVPGKGYYVSTEEIKKKIKVFLLFNKLSAHKKIIYDSFVSSLGEDATIDFYIYNNDYSLFKKLIKNKNNDYSHYVIIPHFVEGGENAHEIINTIPKEKLILLDKKLNKIEGVYGAIYEDFEKDIYSALDEVKERLAKYETIKIIIPEKSYFPKEIVNGFKRFCQQYAFNYKVIKNIQDEVLHKGEVYINLMEDDLVAIIEKAISQDLQVGGDIGIISYNETPLKRLILNGITTVSTDFKAMGAMVAEMIKSQKPEHVAVPFKVNLRPSL